MLKEEITRLKLPPNNTTSWTEEDLLHLASILRKRTKPMIIAANKADIPGAENNVKRLKEKFPNYTVIPCSAEGELALREAAKHGLITYMPGEKDFALANETALNDKQKKALGFIKAGILEKYGTSGVQDVLNASVFDILKMIAIFPGGINKLTDQYGNVLPDCFLIKDGSTAVDFAYKIHTDLGNKFIRAIDVKKKLTVGRDHKLKNLDVVEIVANA
jgi:hypothetical protein